MTSTTTETGTETGTENTGVTVPVGKTTLVNWVIGGLLGLPPVVNQIVALVENEKVKLAGPEKWMAILSISIFAVTGVGRYVQSWIQSKGSSAPEVVIPPESARQPDAVPSPAAGEAAS
jgi:hypothetical protein